MHKQDLISLPDKEYAERNLPVDSAERSLVVTHRDARLIPAVFPGRCGTFGTTSDCGFGPKLTPFS
eukprot:29477-Rhodomonas_salina.2